MSKTILITGGAGFIGSALVRHLLQATDYSVVNLDKLTYAADLRSLKEVENDPRYCFEKADIIDTKTVARLLSEYQPDAIVHLAAETHVDRSIDGPGAFIETNILGTHSLLTAALDYWRADSRDRHSFRFLNVSTDEVFGSLGPTDHFTETSPYHPNSPYAANKASADHLVRAWHVTYGLPILLTNCSNNYGPCQFPEKLIPLTTIRALRGQNLHVYGKGENVRDWVHVEDHTEALTTVIDKGVPGESYIVGADADVPNIEIVGTICDLVDEMRPSGTPRRDLITFVEDRPGHDFRYAVDAAKLKSNLGWRPRHDLSQGLRETVRWYLENEWWWGPHLEKRYDGERIGLTGMQK